MTGIINFKERAQDKRLQGFLLFLFSVVLYSNTINHDYNMDDELVTRKHHLTSKGISAIPDIFLSPYYSDNLGYSYEYRPVTHTTFALEHHFFGESSKTSHFFNTILFGLCALLVGRTVFILSPSHWTLFPLLVGIVFAIHPIHAEAVASIKNRDEILALIFGLFSLIAVHRYSKEGILSGLFLAGPMLILSFLSKFSTAAFLIAFPLMAVLMRAKWNRVFRLSLVMLTTFLAFLSVRDLPFQWGVFLSGVMLFMFGVAAIAINPSPIMEWLKGFFSFQWPQHSSRIFPPFETKQILALGLPIFLLTIYTVIGSNTLLFFALASILVFPYLSGNYVVIYWFVASVITLLTGFHLGLHGVIYLFYLKIVLSVLREHGKNRFSILLAFSFPIAHFLTSWQVHDPTQAFRFLIPYMPLGVFVAVGSSTLSRFVSLVFAVGVAIAVFAPFSFDRLIVLSYVIGVATLTWNGLSIFRRKSVLLISAGILLATIVGFLENEFSSARNEPAPSNGLTTMTVTPTQIATSDLSGGKIINSRPLTYIEYPLGYDANLSTRLGTASVILGHYLKMMFIPWPQAFYYGFDEVPIVNLSDWRAIISIIIHAIILGFGLLCARNHPLLSWGILTYLLSISLFSNFIAPAAGMIADRFAFTPSFGFSLAVGYVIMEILTSMKSAVIRNGIVLSLLCIFILCTGTTIARSALWKDPLTLMSHDIKHVPSSSQANYLLGYNLMQASFKEKSERRSREMRLDAITYLKKAASIFPDYLNYWHDLGKAYRDIGDLRSALPCFKEVHRLDSTFFEATFHVGMIAEELGMEDMAIDYYQRCIRINPGTLTAYNNLAFLHFKKGRMQESIAVNRMAIAQNAKWGDPYENIARAYHQLQMPDSVQYYMQRKAQLN